MQEMQEEVRRRELRASGAILNQHRPPAAMYNLGARVAAPPAQQQASSNTLMNVRSPRTPLGSTSSLGANPGYVARQNAPGYFSDTQYTQYSSAQYGQYNQYPSRNPGSGSSGQYPMMPKPKNEASIARGHHPMPGENLVGARDSNNQETRSYAEQNRHFMGSQSGSIYPNGTLEQRVDQYSSDGVVGRPQNGEGHSVTTSETLPTRPALPSDNAFNESPPPPPPSTSTHPLYKQADTRYVCLEMCP